MSNQLDLYNDALMLCGQRMLASLTENQESRYLLDQVWGSDGVLSCLEEGQWFFAMRTIQIDYDPSIEPTFGYVRAFEKPSDWVITSALCSDEYFRSPLTRYADEAGYWYSDLDTIYVRYVSSDSNYGNDLGNWPKSFHEFVAAHFASKIVWKLTQSEAKTMAVKAERKSTLLEAKNKGLMAQPTSFPPTGKWAKSRLRGNGRWDGGSNGGDLIG
jgi:hypothetical protein